MGMGLALGAKNKQTICGTVITKMTQSQCQHATEQCNGIKCRRNQYQTLVISDTHALKQLSDRSRQENRDLTENLRQKPPVKPKLDRVTVEASFARKIACNPRRDRNQPGTATSPKRFTESNQDSRAGPETRRAVCLRHSLSLCLSLSFGYSLFIQPRSRCGGLVDV